MQAEVIAIGDELVTGQRVDTNSAWLSQQMGRLGICARYHTTVGDDIDALAAAFRLALQRAEVVVATGGLGPTADDVTREALAAATGRELKLDPGVLKHIRSLFARRGRPMPENNKIQAMRPDGSRVIANPQGTAPGIDYQYAPMGDTGSRVFALPGVPAEMRQMWDQSVVPSLRQLGAGKRTILHRRIKCFGVGESELEQMLPELTRRGRTPSVGITVHKATITLRITAEGEDGQACERAVQDTLDTIHDSLGNLVFGEEDDELQHAVALHLRQRKATLATAEWGSDGLLAYWLGGVPEAADFFLGGITISSLEAARRWLGTDTLLEPNDDASSSELAGRMACAVHTLTAAQYALAVGPKPTKRPDDASPRNIHIALAHQDGVSVASRRFVGHPDLLIERTGKQALDYLRLELAEGSRCSD